MSTSGGGVINGVLYVLVIVASVRLVHTPKRSSALPVAVALWVVVAVPSILQGFFPALLTDLRRDPPLINVDGQWWRVITSVLVQDGGFWGTLFNLVTLAIVGTAAVAIWGGTRTLIVFAVGQVLWGLFTTFVSPTVGAGNSGATLALAASVAGLVALSAPPRRDAVVSFGVAIIGAVLVALRDAHGIAVLLGMVIGAVLSVLWPPKSVLQVR
ncbi:rhomboid family intramembrane serine protease [Skermania sp. ID1734]|uniref:rhomboid family intramembrane serine protease n=1 Tax=Skermania sp. ID1734 TaxID=2597516 RepID=UPI00117EF712|nr:rhomboid family intramembrane serine protease [Skermania sp. ID1734]TSE01928.1 rhomboid family intramembrane serine protease [Skermania sp. ID1734]